MREILANFKNSTLKDVSAVMNVNKEGGQAKIKNEGPGNIYYVRCGLQDRSLLLNLVLKAGEEQTFEKSCPEISGYLLNNKEVIINKEFPTTSKTIDVIKSDQNTPSPTTKSKTK